MNYWVLTTQLSLILHEANWNFTEQTAVPGRPYKDCNKTSLPL